MADLTQAVISIAERAGNWWAGYAAFRRYRAAFNHAKKHPSVPNFQAAIDAYWQMLATIEGDADGANPHR